jgi:hypothetical protein
MFHVRAPGCTCVVVFVEVEWKVGLALALPPSHEMMQDYGTCHGHIERVNSSFALYQTVSGGCGVFCNTSTCLRARAWSAGGRYPGVSDAHQVRAAAQDVRPNAMTLVAEH